MHPSAGGSRNAVHLLPHIAFSEKVIGCRELLDDADPQVRLAALLGSAELPADADVRPSRSRNVERLGESERPLAARRGHGGRGAAHRLGFLHGRADEPNCRRTQPTIVAIVAEHVRSHGARTSAAEAACELH